MITNEQIRQKIKDCIKNSELTQTELAQRLGISQQTVSHYCKGSKMPSLDTFANLCAILDVDANDILCVSEYKANNPK